MAKAAGKKKKNQKDAAQPTTADEAVKKKTKKKDAEPKEPVKEEKAEAPEAKKPKATGRHVGSTRAIQMNIHDVKATSKQTYLDNIHAANPQALQTVYWIICPNTPHVVLRVTEAEYQRVVKLTGTMATHHVSFVDCAVEPTLTYGSWQAKDIKGDLPTPKQIKEKDDFFKDHPAVNFHNPPVKAEVVETDEPEDDDDDFDFDFGDDADDPEEDEELELDFSEAN